jgi:sugar phosphate isomerase/epimerase
MGTLHDTADAQGRLLDACVSDQITASLDFANLLIENPQEDLAAVIQRFSRRIGYVHMKNVRLRPGAWDWDVPLREGDINYRRLLPILLETYQGPLGVEYCGSGDPVMVVEDDATYLQDIASP